MLEYNKIEELHNELLDLQNPSGEDTEDQRISKELEITKALDEPIGHKVIDVVEFIKVDYRRLGHEKCNI